MAKTSANTPTNTPLKKPARNKELWKIIGSLFTRLQAENPNIINNLYEFFEKTNFNGRTGLLDQLETFQTQKGEHIEFSHIEEEGFDLKSLLGKRGRGSREDISQTLTSTPSLQPLGWEINSIIWELIKKQITDKINDPTKKASLLTAVSGISNLQTLTDKIQDFMTNDEELKKMGIWDNLRISNKDINDELVSKGAVIANSLSWSSTTWDENIKKSMDALISLELGDAIKQNLETTNGIIKDINSVFSNTFPMMSCVLEQYPFDTRHLINKDSPLYPEAQHYQHIYRNIQINPAYPEEQKNKKIEEIQEKLDNLYREDYLQWIAASEPALAEALKEIWNKKFNFTQISPTTVQFFFSRLAANSSRSLLQIKNILNIKNFMGADFEDFYRDLIDPSKTVINLNGITIPVKKSLKDLNTEPRDLYNNNSKLHTLPITYEINLDDIDGLEITDRVALQQLLGKFITPDEQLADADKGKKIAKIEGDSIWRLIYLFFISRDPNQNLIAELPPKTAEALKEILDPEKLEHPKLEGPEKEDLSIKDNFMEERNKIKWYHSPSTDGWFKVGTRLLVAYMDAQIPPLENGGKEWLQMEITDINETDPNNPKFTVKIKWVGMKAGDYNNQESELSMSKETLQNFQLHSEWKIYKLPDSSSFSNPLDYLKEYKQANKNWADFGGIWVFDELERKWDHFTKDFTGEGEKEKVEYFGYQDTAYDEKGSPHKENLMYAVKYNPNKKTFTLTGNYNIYEKWGAKGYRLDPDHEMDYNSFLTFIGDKKLIPWKKEKAEELIEDQNRENMKLYSKKNIKWNFYSLAAIIWGIKEKRKELMGKMEERKKQQQKQFENRLVDDVGIWDLVDKTLGRIPSIWESVGNLQRERYNERDKEVRWKIEKWLGIFEKDPDFGTTFPETPPHIRRIFKGKSYKQFLTEWDVLDNKTNQFRSMKALEWDDLYKGAALLLANISKGKGMYRGLSEYENSGLWVGKLLGQEHYSNFMHRKRELIAEIETNKKDTDRLREQLSRCEVDYILNNIRGSNPYPNTRFWSIESRGELPDGTPEYIDNPSKRRLSETFAGKLDEAYKNWNSKNNIESIFQSLPNDFNVAKNEFEGKLRSGRFATAMANLKKMQTLMRTDEEKRIVEWCIVTALLSGELNTYPDKPTIRRLSTLGKTAGIIPGFAAKHADHPKRVLHLLNVATKGKFGRELKVGDKEYNPADFWPWAHKVGVKELIGWINARRTKDNYNEVRNFFDNDLLNKDRNHDPIIKDFQEPIFSTDIDIIDNDMMENDDGVNLQGIRANKNVARDRMDYKHGEFNGKDGDEKSARESFWKKVNEQLRNGDISAEVAMKKWKSRFETKGFSENELEKVVQAIKTAYHYKNNIGSTRTLTDEDGEIYKIGKVGSKDREDILRYTFKGKVIQGGTGHPPTAFDNTLDSFLNIFKNNIQEIANDKFIGDVFGAQYKNLKPLKFIGRDRYNEIMGKDEGNYIADALENLGDGSTSNESEKEKKKNRNEERNRHRKFFTRASSEIINTDMRLTEKAIEKYYTTKPQLAAKIDLDKYIEQEI